MLFNNDKFGAAATRAITKSLYNEFGNEESITPPPPPFTYFLLDNTGEILFDNTGEPLLAFGS